jgi:hypothetical protein
MKTVLNNTIAIAMPTNERVCKTPSAVKFIRLWSNPDGGWLKNYNSLYNNNPRSGWLKQLTNYVATFIIVTIVFTSCKTVSQVTTTPPISTSVITQAMPIYKDVALTGTVTDREGLPMQNVQVFFDGKPTMYTDANGAFSIKDNKDIAKCYYIRLEKEGYNNAAQTYHYQMGNTNFNVQMGKPCICPPIIDKTCNCITPLSFVYQKNMYTENEDELVKIVDCLKQNPTCTVTINYKYANDKRSAESKVISVKNYFITRGITESRILTSKEPNLDTNENTVTISSNKVN